MTLMSHSLLCVLLSLALCLTCGCVSTTTAAAQHTVMLGGNRPKVHFTLQAQALGAQAPQGTPETPEQKIEKAFQELNETLTFAFDSLVKAHAVRVEFDKAKNASHEALDAIKKKSQRASYDRISKTEAAVKKIDSAWNTADDARWQIHLGVPKIYRKNGDAITRLFFYDNTEYGKQQPDLILTDAKEAKGMRNGVVYQKERFVNATRDAAAALKEIKGLMTKATLNEEAAKIPTLKTFEEDKGATSAVQS